MRRPCAASRAVDAGDVLSQWVVQGGVFFWWEDLQTLIDAHAVEPNELASLPLQDVEAALGRQPRGIHRLAKAIEDLDVAERRSLAAILAERAQLHRGEARRLTEEQVGEPGARFEPGFQTRQHDVLPPLDDAELEAARLTRAV